jgi:hypothetical protein
MNIVVGGLNIANLVNVLSRGFDINGIKCFAWANWTHSFFNENERLFLSYMHSDEQKLAVFNTLIANYDTFLYIWARSGLLLNIEDELRLLKSLNKQIIIWCVGGDVRPYRLYREWMTKRGRNIRDMPSTHSIEDDAAAIKCYSIVERYADIIISTMDQSFHGTRKFYQGSIPFEINYDLQIVDPGYEHLSMLHVPSSAYKGTNLFMNAIFKLFDDNLSIKVTFGKNFKHKDFLDQLRVHSVLLDELFFPRHGKQAIEAMANGCIAVAGDDEKISPSHVSEIRPIYKTSVDTLYEDLNRLAQYTAKEIYEMRIRSYEYASRQHCHIKVTDALVSLIQCNTETRHFHLVTPEY